MDMRNTVKSSKNSMHFGRDKMRDADKYQFNGDNLKDFISLRKW